MYKTLNEHYREKFGCKVYKLSLDAGLTCPNRDGTLGVGGCIFCSGSGSGEFAEGLCADIRTQLERAKSRVAEKNRSGKYIAYFQSFTNTYAPVEKLRKLYFDAIEPEEIVGLAIGTRPDCLGDDVITLLEEVNILQHQTVHILEVIFEFADLIDECDVVLALPCVCHCTGFRIEFGIKILVFFCHTIDCSGGALQLFRSNLDSSCQFYDLH